MRAELRSLTTVTGDPLDNIVYSDGEDFTVTLCAYVGAHGEEGEDIFYLTAISPGAIAAFPKQSPRFLRQFLLMTSFSEKTVRAMVEKLCNSTSGDSWKTIAEKLSRYMVWEFENYHAPES